MRGAIAGASLGVEALRFLGLDNILVKSVLSMVLDDNLLLKTELWSLPDVIEEWKWHA